jgi:hypothetical protein
MMKQYYITYKRIVVKCILLSKIKPYYKYDELGGTCSPRGSKRVMCAKF